MDKNCCIFTETLCTISGDYVVARMKLVEGVLSIVYYDMSGNVYTNNDIIFPTCVIPPTNFIDVLTEILDAACFNDVAELRVSNIWGLNLDDAMVNGSIIHIKTSNTNSEIIQDAYINSSVIAPVFSLSYNSTDIFLEIINIGLLATNQIPVNIKFANVGCSIPNTYNVSVVDIINPIPTWGLGASNVATIFKP